MKKFFLLVILLLSGLDAQAQAKALIVGRWNLVETIKDTTSGFETLFEFSTEDPEDVDKQDKNDKETTFYFSKGDEFQDRYFGKQYRDRYRVISDEVIVIGEFTYQILLLTRTELRLQLYEEELSFPVPQDILVFQKSEEPFKLIKEFENNLIYYGSGRKKEEGQFHNGYEHGIWKEWHPNGQLKSEKRFTDGIPIGIWKTWDQNGKLIKEENKNIF